MATISTPIAAWVASILTATGTAQSSSIYVTVSITGGWELQVPVQVLQSTVSADHVVNIYPTMDGGATYDQTPFTSFSVARLASGTSQGSIRLSTGQYLMQILVAGPSSQRVAVLTQLVITAINNV